MLGTRSPLTDAEADFDADLLRQGIRWPPPPPHTPLPSPLPSGHDGGCKAAEGVDEEHRLQAVLECLRGSEPVCDANPRLHCPGIHQDNSLRHPGQLRALPLLRAGQCALELCHAGGPPSAALARELVQHLVQPACRARDQFAQQRPSRYPSAPHAGPNPPTL